MSTQGNRNKNSTNLSGVNHLVRILDEFQGVNATNLQSIISLLQQNRDFEVKLVKDANGDLYLYRIIYNEATGVTTYDYLDADGNVVSPVLPVQFIDVESILTLIYNALLPIQGTDTPDILEISGVSTVTLPAGCKGYSIYVFDGTVTHDNGSDTRTLRHNVEYRFNTNLDRGFVQLVIEGTDADADAIINIIY
jgi:hypothetical protein